MSYRFCTVAFVAAVQFLFLRGSMGDESCQNGQEENKGRKMLRSAG